jgi:hypothetical protein
LLAAESGEHGIRVNGVNPDGVVRGSGIFAAGWGAQRAAVYGVEEEKLGEFYAQRTILKREALPEHVANAVFALTGGESTHTTGLHVPVEPASRPPTPQRLLLIPDLLTYWLTGEQGTELTNASTTQLIDSRTREWSYDRLRAAGGGGPDGGGGARERAGPGAGARAGG